MHTISSVSGLNPFSICTLPFFHYSSFCTFDWYPKLSLSDKFSSTNYPFRLQFPICPVLSSNDGAVSVVDFEDLGEKDWSFLDSNDDLDLKENIDRIVSAGNITETSRIMVSLGSESFVDKLVSSSNFEQLLVVHDSLFILASIKEKYDKIKCWQGELIDIPEIWSPFDVVFLYLLPALSLELDQILASLAKQCSPGARVVISHPQGKKGVEEQKQRFPNVVISSLPLETTLMQTAAQHLFEVVESIDEDGFYLVVLKLKTS